MKLDRRGIALTFLAFALFARIALPSAALGGLVVGLVQYLVLRHPGSEAGNRQCFLNRRPHCSKPHGSRTTCDTNRYALPPKTWVSRLVAAAMCRL